MRLAVAALAVAFGLAWCPPLRAYCRSANCSLSGTLCVPAQTSDCDSQSRPLAWKRPCVGIAVQTKASAQVGYAAAAGVLQRAAERWTHADCGAGSPSIRVERLIGVECSEVEYNCPPPSCPRDGANVNVVVFRDHGWPHPGGEHDIALTTVSFDPATGEIVDADIEVNTSGYVLTTTAETTDYDLPSVLTHELGHLLGMAHSSDADATMYRNVLLGETQRRTLAPDDVAGICAAYPPGDAGGICNPIPKHGFSSACAAEQSEGSCSASGTGSGRDAAAIAAIAFGALVAAAAARRAARSERVVRWP